MAPEPEADRPVAVPTPGPLPEPGSGTPRSGTSGSGTSGSGAWWARAAGWIPSLAVTLVGALPGVLDRLERVQPAGVGSGVRFVRSEPFRRWRRRLATFLGVLLVGVAGAALGTALVPEVPAQVGPLALQLRVVPSLHPGVHLLLPPAGRVEFDTHQAPLALEARVSEVDLEGARVLIESPEKLQSLQRTAPDALRVATVRAAGLTAGYALTGGVVMALLVYRRRWRRTGQVAATLVGVIMITGGTSLAGFDSDRLAQPRFEGLLSQAPYVASQTSGLVQRLETYRSGLSDLVQGITTLYAKSGELPIIPGAGGDNVITVLHVSDMHLNPIGFDLTDRLVRQFKADLVVDTGDITSWGTEVESSVLSRIRMLGVPYVFVRGNHDSQRTQRAVAENANAVVLDGDVAEVKGLVIAGLGDPRFTPDAEVNLPTGSPGPSSGPAVATVPSAGANGSGTTRPGSGPGLPSPGVSTPTPSVAARAVVPGEDPEVIEGRRLASVIRAWNAEHPAQPVQVAAFHEPAGTTALDGVVPLVLAGHLHARSVRDYPAGTRVMVEGSTGGAGASGLNEIVAGKPTPLDASLLYFARSGPRAGQLLAHDDVTVGGFGLASVSLTRTVVRPDEKALLPGQVRGSATACPSPATGSPGLTGLTGTAGPAPGGGPTSAGAPDGTGGAAPITALGAATPAPPGSTVGGGPRTATAAAADGTPDGCPPP